MNNLAKWHAPMFYRYKVATPRKVRLALNRYPGIVIGAAIVIGHYAYCVKWGKARAVSGGGNGLSFE